MVPAGIVTAAGFAALRDRFATLVDSDFDFVDAHGAALTARLVALDDARTSGGFEQFSVVFEGDGLAEGLYQVRHPALGSLHIGFTAPGESLRQRAWFSQPV